MNRNLQAPLKCRASRTAPLAIGRDATARKDAEIALRYARDAVGSSDQAKSEFLANLSHESRAPMHGIIAMTDLISTLDLTPEQQAFIDTIRLSADSLLPVIDDVIDLAKIEAGQFEISVKAFSIAELAEETLQSLKPEADAKRLSLNLVFGSFIPRMIESDAVRLRQALVNIIGNAIKFTSQGGIIVEVDYATAAQELRITVSDTGIGIPENKLARLFTPFFQVESSASPQYGGAGLGLAISRAIVSLLGGVFRVESEVGKGSTFRFSVKALTSDFNPAFSPLSGHRVLAVTDDPIGGDAIEQQLTNWGIAVARVSSRPEAVRDALLAGNYSLLALDESANRPDTIQTIELCQTELGERFPEIVRLVASEPMDTDLSPTLAQTLQKPLRPSRLYGKLATLAPLEKAISHETADSAASEKSIPPSETPMLLADSCPLRILVVEDNPINTKVLVNILKKLGYTADTAENGELGLAAAESTPYDLVLMDLQMPVMDGLECARRILASEKIGQPIFISAFTANARQEDRDACQEVGMHDFVAKPARIPAISAVLERAFAWIQQRTPVAD